ncbi:MAG: hypothetical protein FRX48_02447 [Lasallia pustulata]|uniref:General stress protein FMN-binding split barrel domain-containing protein n=1 Tax=Lasallia pustulata TaxID=136370 RepID=A0A5M8PWR9_9LECA|nr:MAG: hypothetical protein FRX48_02447 [Lasallia pustulata]
MPEPLKASEINTSTDPSVAKQWDTSTPIPEQISDLYKIVDTLKFCLLGTRRPNIGHVSRCMGIAKREGPDFYFLSNKHSRKFQDLDNNPDVQITFQDSSSQNWVSISGTAVVVSNDDPKIKELYQPGMKAWFGDLGDGVHTGTAEDPRMAMIKVESKYVAYWKSTSSSLGFIKEVAQAAFQGSVATTGVQRELTEEVLQQARSSKE